MFEHEATERVSPWRARARGTSAVTVIRNVHSRDPADVLASHPNSHSAAKAGMPGSKRQDSRMQAAVLQLQRQYGNRYVARAVRLAQDRTLSNDGVRSRYSSADQTGRVNRQVWTRSIVEPSSSLDSPESRSATSTATPLGKSLQVRREVVADAGRYTASSPEASMLSRGFGLARAMQSPVTGLLRRALYRASGYAAASQSVSGQTTVMKKNTHCASCGGELQLADKCLACGERAARNDTAASRLIHRSGADRNVIARDGSGGGRTRLQCINANLANAGIPWAVIGILGGVCGILGGIAGLGGGPAAPATAPSGMALAAAVCIAGVTGLTVGTVLGVITRCCQDPSVEWVFAQNEGGGAKGGNTADTGGAGTAQA